jgi:hypothetical protein
MAALADGSGAVFAPVLPVEVPVNRSGLLVRAAGPIGGGEPLTAVQRASAVLVADSPGVQFIVAHRSTLAPTAFGLVASRPVAVVVLCPGDVPVERTALALAVGDVLWARTGEPAVVCAELPRAWSSPSATGHPVLVRDPAGVVTAALVWQMAGWTRMRGWLDTLGKVA